MSFTTEDTFPHFARRRDLDINVAALGAEGKNPTRDTAIIQDAIRVAEGRDSGIILPRIYRTNAPLEIREGALRFIGTGMRGSGIVNAVSDLFTAPAGAGAAINDVVFSDVVLTSEIGGGHVFAPGANPTGVLGRWIFDRVRIAQANLDKSLWRQVDAGGLVGAAFQECMLIHAQGATVPGFHMLGSGGLFNANKWIGGSATHSGEYFFHIENTNASYAYNNVFRDLYGELLVGGFAKILSGKNTQFENIQNFDMQVVGPSIRDWFYIGKSAAGLSSQFTTFRNCTREGGALGGGLADIKLIASQVGRTIIDAVHHDSLVGYVIDCGNTSVDFQGHPTGLTVINPPQLSVASAAALAIPVTAYKEHAICQVTGAVNITSIGATYPGHIVTLKFSSNPAPTVVEGGNLIMAGNFVATQNSTITFASYDGANWWEIGRMLN